MMNSLNGVKFQAQLPVKAQPAALPTETFSAPAAAQPASSGGAQALGAYNQANILFAGSELEKTGAANPVDTLLANKEQVTDWSWQHTPKGVSLSGKLNGTDYRLTQEKTGETEQRDDGKYYVMKNTLTQQQADGTQTVTELSAEQGLALLESLETVAYRKIEQEYGLGPDLDTSPVLVKLAEQTLAGQVQWEAVDAAVGFEGIMPTVSGAIRTVMTDGTEVLVMEKSSFFDSETYVGLRQPGQPAQSIKLGDAEDAAKELLSGAMRILQKEEEVVAAQAQIREARQELGQAIEEKKAGLSSAPNRELES